MLKLTVLNSSPIVAEMILDLRHIDENPPAQNGVECLEIKLAENNEDAMLHSVYNEDDEKKYNFK